VYRQRRANRCMAGIHGLGDVPMTKVTELKSLAHRLLSNGQTIDWETVIVLGEDKAGHFRIASTTNDLTEMLFLLEIAKRDVMNDADPT